MHKKKKLHLSKKGKYTILAGFMIIFLIGLPICYFTFRPVIVFHQDTIQIEINQQFEEPLSQIKKLRKGQLTEVVVDTSQIDFSKLGKYPVLYTIGEKEYELNVEIIDKTAPQFDILAGQTDKDIEVDPKNLVTNIQDETKTTVYFEKEYDFSQEGTIDVVVVVTDEGNNETKKNTTVKILPKDQIAPQVSYEKEITLQKGATFNPLDTIQIKDNQDPHPVVKIASSKLDTNKIGKYEIAYIGTDRSKNEIEFIQTIEIVERTEIGREESNGENIIYLTFDDGPSYNTPKVLEILKQHHVKATFFVTGTSPEYNHYIQQAYNQGHTIGLHTYSHDYSLVYRSTKDYFDDLNKISEMVKELTGETSLYIRFPGGSSNTVSAEYKEGIMTDLSKQVIDRGYQYYDWNVSSQDASGNNVDVNTIIKSATADDSGNLMLLFHDGRNKDTTVEALPKVIEYYKNLGFVFATIDDDAYVCHHGVNN